MTNFSFSFRRFLCGLTRQEAEDDDWKGAHLQAAEEEVARKPKEAQGVTGEIRCPHGEGNNDSEQDCDENEDHDDVFGFAGPSEELQRRKHRSNCWGERVNSFYCVS